MVEKRRPTGIDPHGTRIRIRVKAKGRSHTETIPGDYFNARDLAAAVNRRKTIKSRMELGLPINEGDQSQFSLFAKDAQSYLNVLEVDFSTSLSYEGDLNQYWLPAFGNHITQEITTRQIKDVLAEATCGLTRKRNVLISIRGVLDYAEVIPNPAAFKIKKGTKKKIQRYKPKQREALMKEIDKMGDPQMSCYFALLFGCGLRPSGEPLGLKWTDWDEPRLHVQRTIVRRRFKPTTKTHLDRHVYVPKWVRPYINSLPSRFNDEWLFLNTCDRPYLDSDVFNQAWQKVFETKKIKRTLKLEYQIPYICRHTRAAELLSTGVEPGKAAKELGHSLEMFYRTYSEWIEEYSTDTDELLEGFTKSVPEVSTEKKEI